MHLLQRIGYVVVFVTKWDDAMRFYADVLGIEVVQRRDEEGFARFRFPQAGPDLLIEQVDNPEAVQAHDLVGHFVGLSVTVGDIGEAYERLSAKGVRQGMNRTLKSGLEIECGTVLARQTYPDEEGCIECVS